MYFNSTIALLWPGLWSGRPAGRSEVGLLPPELVRPLTPAPANPVLARARFVPFLARRAAKLWQADVVHVHYATSARLLRERGMPSVHTP